MYRTLVRRALFAYSRGDPERAHDLSIGLLERAGDDGHALTAIRRSCRVPADDGRGKAVFGLWFPNPVGLAAGFDKNGRALPAFAAMGFGFVEAGTVTRFAQAGKDRPRIFRFPQDSALINRMGFPNRGSDAVAAAAARAHSLPVPLGWNIGKSLVTPLEEATDDYLYTLRALYPHGDFFTLNVSSPNTPGLRDLQNKQALDELLSAVMAETTRLTADGAAPKPVLLKITPDLSEAGLDDVVEVAVNRGIAGIIATNTTLGRDGLSHRTGEVGGLSGRPLAARSLATVTSLARRLDGRLPIVGVGGIHSPKAADRMLDAGASLVQLYTGFIFEGPQLIRDINARVRERWLGPDVRPMSAQLSDHQ